MVLDGHKNIIFVISARRVNNRVDHQLIATDKADLLSLLQVLRVYCIISRNCH